MLTILLPLCVLATSAISGVLGMAGGMILMGVLVSILPVASAIIIHAAAQFVANASRAILHRRSIVWRAMRHYAAGAAAGTLLMSLFFFVPDKATVFLLLGILPFAQVLLARHVHFDIMRPLQGFACGFLSILLHLGGGVAGVLIDVFYQRGVLTRHQVVATKSATQTLAHTVRFAYFSAMSGSVGGGLEDIGAPALLAVAVSAIAGTVLAGRVLDRISDRHFRQATQWVLLALGAFFLFRAFTLYMA